MVLSHKVCRQDLVIQVQIQANYNLGMVHYGSDNVGTLRI